MSLEMVEAALADFVSSKDSRLVALSGPWGVGKTYYWKRFVERQAAKVGPPLYSYVSLFGIPDLSSLKDAVFESSVRLHEPGGLQGGREITFRDRVMDLRTRLAQAVGPYLGLIGKVPKLKEIAPFLRSVAFLSVSDYLICLDDLERHSRALPLKDILGFMTMLRDERKSRVLAILNTDALGGDDAEDYKRFREKVFDYEITFRPSPEDSIGIVFPNKGPYTQAAEYSQQLGIQNLRILSRAKRVIDLLAPYVSELDPAVMRQVIHSSVLLTWCYNSHGENAPPFDYVRRLNFGAFIKLPDTKDVPAEKSKWNDLLSRYDYTNTDDLDLVICDILEQGFLDQPRVLEAVSGRHDAAVRVGIEQEFKAAWDIYHGGFGNDEVRLASAFDQSFRKGARWINLVNASATTRLLRDLGHEELADDLMNYWIKVQSENNPVALNLENNDFLEDVKDQAFLKAVAKASSALGKAPTLDEVARSLSKKNGWNPVDERVLSAASEDDFYRLFKSLSGAETRSCIRACLRFGEFERRDYVEIGAKARAALQRIGAESPLNRRRVQSFGIDVPNQTAPKVDDNKPAASRH